MEIHFFLIFNSISRVNPDSINRENYDFKNESNSGADSDPYINPGADSDPGIDSGADFGTGSVIGSGVNNIGIGSGIDSEHAIGIG